MKRCPECGQELPHSAFGRNKSLRDGLSFYCLACTRKRNNAWYRRHRETLGKPVRDLSWVPEGFRWCPSCEQAVAHEDYIRNAGTASGFGSRCRACDRAANSDSYFYRKYKLTRAALASLRAAQDNRCAICGDANPQHLDHDHDSGRIRALLCQRCNHGLGLFRDEPGLLHTAGLYVEGHRQRHAYERLVDAATNGPEGASRPDNPPVGSQRRPGQRSTSTRSTRTRSRSRRREQAGEADQ